MSEQLPTCPNCGERTLYAQLRVTTFEVRDLTEWDPATGRFEVGIEEHRDSGEVLDEEPVTVVCDSCSAAFPFRYPPTTTREITA
jgi:acetylornithine deacetylase/succinyl-diaminopimelate desuccinylase-like protein